MILRIIICAFVLACLSFLAPRVASWIWLSMYRPHMNAASSKHHAAHASSRTFGSRPTNSEGRVPYSFACL